jgi:hypothetical protein
MEDPAELRKLAEWYRAFAEVGRADQRESRLKFADYLEQTAEDLEERAARGRGPPSRRT